MPTFRFVSMKNRKPEKESMAKAKGKTDKRLSNEIFAAVDDFFYEFGFSSKPTPKNDLEEK